MSTESRSNLREETIEKLQTLICYNIDSHDGFMKCSEHIESPHLASLFRDLAHERSAMATELQDYVEWNREDAANRGSVKGAIHRLWIDVKSKFTDWSPPAILAEAERGEEQIRKAYEDVLKDIPESALNNVIQQQYARIKSAHGRIRDLRNQYQD